MKELVFPSGGTAKARTLLSLLGSFWNTFYSGADQVEGYLKAKSKADVQTYLDLLEHVRKASRFDVPVFHKKNWYLLTLTQSEVMDDEPINFGADGFIIGTQLDGDTINFGEGPLDYVRFPISSELIDAPVIFNRLTDPSLTLVKDIDYRLNDDDTISFLRNPFNETSLIPQRPILDSSGTQVDAEIGLWVFRGDFDIDAIYEQWAYMLGIKSASSEGYRDLVNALFDAITGCTAFYDIEKMIVAMTGIPVTIEAQETVEALEVDADHLVIATEHHLYKFHREATSVVEVGDVLTAGSPLVDAFEIVNLNRGIIPASVAAISLDSNMLLPVFQEGLTFPNREVATVVGTEDDKTTIRFEIGGNPDDIELFWDLIHSRGMAEGRTLAECMDTRTVQDTQPIAQYLPSTINPAEFVAQNVLRYNAILVILNTSLFGDTAAGLDHVNVLRKIMPPEQMVIFLLSLTMLDENITLDSAGDMVSVAGFEESFEELAHIAELEDTVDDTLFLEDVTLSYV